MNFADRLSEAVSERRSQVVLGLDPDPGALLPAAVRAAAEGSPAQRAASAVTAHCGALIEAAADACVAVKFQLACFERLGAAGWGALADCVTIARDAGLLTIADGKRGDVPHTAAVYAQALTGTTETPWGSIDGLGVDAVTANPLLGREAVEPIVAGARAAGAGVFVLVRTSNPGAAGIQDSGEPPLHERLAALVTELGEACRGTGGLSDVGAVVGATQPRLIGRLRQLMPTATFLLPGVGAQGGRVSDLAPAFAPGPSSGLVVAARSIVGPALEAGDVSAAGAAAERLRTEAWALAGSSR